jgi:glycosyltransferase involved in cell wall biosynthesis
MLTRAAARVVGRLTLQRRVVLVTDQAGWILDEVAQALRARLPQDLDATVVSEGWQSARRCTIHFLDRRWLSGHTHLDAIHPSNRIVGLWWHGQPQSVEPGLREGFERLPALHPRFARMQVSCAAGRAAMRAAGVPEAKIVELPEGVDTRAFRPAASAAEREAVRRDLAIPEGAFAIGCFQKDGVGWGDGLEPKVIKGPDVLAEALIRLRPTHPVHAVIPGPSRGYLKRRLAEAGVPFSAPGWVARDALRRCYHALDAYVSPSRDEGGPAGVLEAMASGVPVVSTRTGMAADILDHGVNGFLADIEDVEGLAAGVGALIASPSRCRAVAEQGRRMIAAYDWDAVAPLYAQRLYRPLAAERR